MQRGTIEFAAHQVAGACLRVQPGENVVIITDAERKEEIGIPIANAVAAAGGSFEMFVMEELGERPDKPDDEHPALAFPPNIATFMEKAQVSIFAASGKPGELDAFRRPMIKLVKECKLRHGHMPGINRLIMEMGMCADYYQVQMLSARVYGALLGTHTAHLTTPVGTDLHVEFDGNKWCIDDGNIKPGVLANLPAGEVFSYAMNANGVIVVDGFIGDAWNRSVQEAPIRIEVKDGRMVSLICTDKTLEEELIKYLAQDADANRLAEFAVGTNLGVTAPIGGLLQVEKFPAVHVAFGDGYKGETGCPWESRGHVDMVLMNPTLTLDDGRLQIFGEDGKFNPELLG